MSLLCDRRDGWAGSASAPGETGPSAALRAWLNEPSQLEAFARLEHLVSRRFGCGLLAGPSHCGKSLLLRSFRSQLLRSHATVVSVDGAGLDADELEWQLAACCGLAPDCRSSRRCVRQSLVDFLEGVLQSGRRVVLLLDHADAMKVDALHGVCRILRMAEAAGPVTAVWAARSPLAAVLRETLLPLTELRIDAQPLSERETEACVLQASGRPAETFDPEAVSAIHEYSAGRLRRAEQLCTLALMAAQADDCPTISRDLIDAVAIELA